MIVESLHLYPLKGGRRLDVTETRISRLGMDGDRRWMVVDRSGNFMTQRAHPRLALVRLVEGPDGVSLSAPGAREYTLESTQLRDASMRVEIWGDWVDARHPHAQIDRWMSELLETECHVVRFDERTPRASSPAWAEPGDATAFADGFAILVTGTASLAALNAALTSPVPMTRFRPNVVVRTAEPWVEDRWRRIRVGAVELSIVKPCGRCVTINVDQETARTGREPLRTLAAMRTVEIRGEPRVVFGQNAVPRGVGEVRIADPVVVLEGS